MAHPQNMEGVLDCLLDMVRMNPDVLPNEGAPSFMADDAYDPSAAIMTPQEFLPYAEQIAQKEAAIARARDIIAALDKQEQSLTEKRDRMRLNIAALTEECESIAFEQEQIRTRVLALKAERGKLRRRERGLAGTGASDPWDGFDEFDDC